MATTVEPSENSHQGFEGIKAALCLGAPEVNSNTASEMPVCLWQNGIRSRSTGKERDAETGLDYFGARYLSSAQGRFTSPDPLLNSGRPDNPQSWNRYSYVFNNPLRYVDPTGLYVWAASGCDGDKDCEKKYKQNQQEFRDSLTYLKMSRDSFDKKSSEYRRLDASLKAYGKEGDAGVTVGFQSLDAEGRTDPNGNGTYNVLFDPNKMGAGAKMFASAVGHEGTHVSDLNLMLGGASILSDFSLEYRGYETSAFVFQGLFTPSLSASTGATLNGVASRGISFRGIQIWNTSWAGADAPKLRDAAITNLVTGLDSKHPETTPHDPWRQ
jgi:RHS repeat-associated protein